MDADVLRAIAKWPDVPAVFGWMRLDRRGRFWVKDTPVTHELSRGFIARNYGADDRGRWYFQNGPQKVFVDLEETPLVFRWLAGVWTDQLGRPVDVVEAVLVDEFGHIYLAGNHGLGLIDDRDLLQFAAALRDGEGHELGPAQENALLAAMGTSRLPEVFWRWRNQAIELESAPRKSLEGRFRFVRSPQAG